MTHACALTIAGLDPSGGAGILSDAIRIAREGVHPMAVVSALTVQTSRGVARVEPVAPRVFRAQLKALFADAPIAAVKTGLLPSAAHVDAVAELVPRRMPLVVDPVLASSDGFPFLDERGLRRLRDALLPRATLVTPNLEEAARLAGASFRAKAVLIKGGHGRGRVLLDLLVDEKGLLELRSPRIPGTARGLGCALSAVIAARLALGDPLRTAVRRARLRLRDDLRAARRLGEGRPTLGF